MSATNSLSIVRALEQTIEEGQFAGRTFRYTNDAPRKSSVIDWIVLVTGLSSKSSTKILERIKKADPTVASKMSLLQFPGERQRATPVATAANMIQIIGMLPSKYIESFERERNNLMTRYLGGDTSLGAEAERLRDMQSELAARDPDNPLRLFGEAVESGSVGHLNQYIDERNEARAQSIDEYHEKVAAIKQNAALNRDVLIKTNAEISRASLGMYPREFRHLRNLKRHVSVRDFMDTAQLYSVALGETVTKNMAGEQSQTAADFNQKILTMTQRLFDFNKDYGIHGDKNMPRLTAPQRLEEIAAAPTPLALTH